MNANNQQPVFTQEYINSLACWDCKKKTKTNRLIQINDIITVGEPIVMCGPCLTKLMNIRKEAQKRKK